MENTEPKYEYHLYTWGGFYNEEYFKIHQKPQGDFWFDTAEERQQFIDELRAIEDKLNARYLSMTLSEGYCCRISTVLHRVVEWEGKRYYSKYDIGINYPFSAAKYHLEHKWTCGFNDYPLGEDFDYDTNKPKVIQEWITGAEQELESDSGLNDCPLEDDFDEWRVELEFKHSLQQTCARRRFSNLSFEQQGWIRELSAREGFLANYIQLMADDDLDRWINAFEQKIKDGERRRDESI